MWKVFPHNQRSPKINTSLIHVCYNSHCTFNQWVIHHHECYMSMINPKTPDETFTNEKWTHSNTLVHMWDSRWPYRHITSVACVTCSYENSWMRSFKPSKSYNICQSLESSPPIVPHQRDCSFLSLLFLSGCLSLYLCPGVFLLTLINHSEQSQKGMSGTDSML